MATNNHLQLVLSTDEELTDSDIDYTEETNLHDHTHYYHNCSCMSQLPEYNEHGEEVEYLTLKREDYPYHTQERLAESINIVFKCSTYRDFMLTIIKHTFTHTSILLESTEIFTMVTHAIEIDDQYWFMNQYMKNNNYIHLLYLFKLTKDFSIMWDILDYMDKNEKNVYRHILNINIWFIKNPTYSKKHASLHLLW